MTLIRCIVAAVLLLSPSYARAVSCGTVPLDSRFDAVCGLANRSMPYDSAWIPVGSGTYVRWTDPQNVERVGIMTVQHFLDGNANPSGACDSQVDLWYAYFRCQPACSNCACIPLCIGENEEVFRVRIKCFRLATAPFREGTAFVPDGVVIAEIEPEDVCYLSQITPIEIGTTFDLEVCAGQVAYIAGWGRTLPPPLPDPPSFEMPCILSILSSRRGACTSG